MPSATSATTRSARLIERVLEFGDEILDVLDAHREAHEPVADAERVGPVAIELLRRFGPRRPVRLLGVRLAGLEPGRDRDEEQLQLAV